MSQESPTIEEWMTEFPIGQEVGWRQWRATVIGYTSKRIMIRLRNGREHRISPWMLRLKG